VEEISEILDILNFEYSHPISTRTFLMCFPSLGIKAPWKLLIFSTKSMYSSKT